MNGLAELRIDLRIDSMRAAIQNALSVRAEQIQREVDVAVDSFDLERAIREAVHREMERAVKASVEFQLGEAVAGPVRRAVQEILVKAGH